MFYLSERLNENSRLVSTKLNCMIKSALWPLKYCILGVTAILDTTEFTCGDSYKSYKAINLVKFYDGGVTKL